VTTMVVHACPIGDDPRRRGEAPVLGYTGLMALPSEVKGGGLERGALVAGRYRIEAPLGHGGAGSVYRVFDERDERVLALKQLRLHDEKHAALLAMQFEREYHTLCQLAHPHIIAVYDYGVEAGAAFYTMELLDGEDLQSLGVLPWQRACALLCDVASSLAILHARGLLHRAPRKGTGL